MNETLFSSAPGETLRTFEHPLGTIDLVMYDTPDVEANMRYLHDSSTEFLEYVGFNARNLMPEDQMRERILRFLGGNDPFLSMGIRLNGRSVGKFGRENESAPGRATEAHFHLFDPEVRGKGFGKSVFWECLQLIEKLEKHGRYWVEPKASNKEMNAMIRSLGFKDLGVHFRKSHSQNIQDMDVRRWEIVLNN